MGDRRADDGALKCAATTTKSRSWRVCVATSKPVLQRLNSLRKNTANHLLRG